MSLLHYRDRRLLTCPVSICVPVRKLPSSITKHAIDDKMETEEPLLKRRKLLPLPDVDPGVEERIVKITRNAGHEEERSRDGHVANSGKPRFRGIQLIDLNAKPDERDWDWDYDCDEAVGKSGRPTNTIDLNALPEERDWDVHLSAMWKERDRRGAVAVSMMDLLPPEEVRKHISCIKSWADQKIEKSMDSREVSCQLCKFEQLVHDLVPIYCTPCRDRIEKNAIYYVYSDNQRAVCINCFQRSAVAIEIENKMVHKSQFKMKKNDEEIEEEWVQCDNCEEWLHQICALFNGLRNTGDEVKYTCPRCYLCQLEGGVRLPLPESAMPGAKDLPRTRLSDFMEKRLFEQLEIERKERAHSLGKMLDVVPGAEGLVLRVVSSVDMMLKVKPGFSTIFKGSYPTHFPYKSKAILLFQKIDGVDVCLFAMIVHEFGSDCTLPNQRSVYLSYVDSVKYFVPDVKCSNGEPLRTFVFHQVLIGYLDWSKKHDFSRCYLWSCPPLEGDDCIFYCHPPNQKTPKPHILRGWYHSMLEKALKENIAVGLTNLYDHYFTGANVTAVRLPYFQGDFWPGAAEEIIGRLLQEDNDPKQQRSMPWKGNLRNCTNLSGSANKDAKIMQELGDKILPCKDDFMVVHLQHTCNHCGDAMISGTCWRCNSCECFNLCDKCHEAECLRELSGRHPGNSKEKHLFIAVKIVGVPMDAADRGETIESEYMKTHLAFLSFCQQQHYQFDSLRRAKHALMMVVHHLHSSTISRLDTAGIMWYSNSETSQSKRLVRR